MLQPNWVDLPKGDFSLILGYQNEQVTKLNTLTCAYHDLEKQDEDSLAIRVERLEDIIEYLQNWLEHRTTAIDKVKHLKILKEIAEGKRNYLLELVKISLQGCDVTSQLKRYHTDSATTDEYEKIYLNTQRLYSIKKCAYWGDFYWVTLDPCHRQLTSYLMAWEESVKDQKKEPIDFFLWLENQYVPNNFPTERYFNSQELNATEIKIIDGLLHTADLDPKLVQLDDVSKKYLYVIGLDMKLRIAEETHEVFHSSFYNGKPVYSAGKIKVSQGQITAVSFESGHYIPSIRAGYQLFDLMNKLGHRFTNHVEVSYFYDRNKYTAQIEKQFLNTYEDFDRKIKSGLQRCNEGELHVA